MCNRFFNCSPVLTAKLQLRQTCIETINHLSKPSSPIAKLTTIPHTPYNCLHQRPSACVGADNSQVNASTEINLLYNICILYKNNQYHRKGNPKSTETATHNNAKDTSVYYSDLLRFKLRPHELTGDAQQH